jgi:glycosyltransferase A (GT-A) superfamily protein (DUF2064 family)
VSATRILIFAKAPVPGRVKTRLIPTLFSDLPWSTAAVAELTLARIEALSWQVWVGAKLQDIDEPADLSCL